MFGEKTYWVVVWEILRWNYVKPVPLSRKIKYLLWALITPWFSIPYYLLVIFLVCLEKTSDICGDVAVWVSDFMHDIFRGIK